MRTLLLLTAVVIFCQSYVLSAVISEDPAQLAYNLKTTVAAYEKVGIKNQRWNAAAEMCLSNFACIRAWTNGFPTELVSVLQTNLSQLSALKCDDPFVRYLYVRFVLSNSKSQNVNPSTYEDAALGLQKSQYPEIRKFYAVGRAYTVLLSSGHNSPETSSFLDTATSDLAQALADKSMPLNEVDQACDLLMSAPWWAEPTRWNCYKALEPNLTNNWDGTSAALLEKGRAIFLTLGRREVLVMVTRYRRALKI